MNINELVPSFEVCKEAKELGFPQDTYFHYSNIEGVLKIVESNLWPIPKIESCAAPTLQEAIAVLPCKIVQYQEETTYWLFITKTEFKDNRGLIYTVCYSDDYDVVGDLYNIRHVNPTQAALELWIKLRKDGVI